MPDPFDTLTITLGPDVRVVGLEDRHVVRVTGRADHAPGNAVHLTGVPDAPVDVEAELAQRFPTGAARFVLPRDRATLVEPGGLRAATATVLRRDPAAPHGTGAGRPGRADLTVDTPPDDRAWHGVTVLHRHAATTDADHARRARGGDDERLAWWVDGLRRLVGEGRARVLRATRFGTPVGVGVLHWAPGLPVDDDHAGLGVVADVVVHPAHRGLGVARTVVDALVERHLADFPRAAVRAVADPVPVTVEGARATPPHGWVVEHELLVLTRPADGADRPQR